ERGRPAAAPAAAAAVVYGGAEGAALSPAGVSQEPGGPAALVRRPVGGGRRGSAAGAPRPDQPAGDQAEDEQLAQETPRTSALPSANQEVPPVPRHGGLNGIGFRAMSRLRRSSRLLRRKRRGGCHEDDRSVPAARGSAGECAPPVASSEDPR